ncbi:MAG: hypothetical protein FWC39_04140 [Bacteroidetes bacterium]|nr:hypothetical protein [Bacteroidota bacterium]
MGSTTIALISLAVTILLAITSYLFKYFYELNVQRHNNNLKLINERLENFYGPLYILSMVGKTSYETLLKVLKKEDDPDLQNPLSEQEKLEWIIWVKEVFHKNNLEIEKIIINKAYLIIEESVPQCLIDFVTHISYNKILLKKWDNNNFEQIHCLIDFPVDFDEYVYNSYRRLTSEQLKYGIKK